MEWWAIRDWAHSADALLFTAAVMTGLVGCSRLGRRGLRDAYKRGALLADGRASQRRSARLKQSGAELLTLAGIAVAAADETKHFKLIGTTGTGKSTAIRELLGSAIARGDRAVFADPDGGYLAQFYDRYRGDIVLNPFEQDSVKWDLFAEIENNYDVEQLAGGLIPSSIDPSASEWRGYARTFLTAVVRRCYVCGWRDMANLWRLLTMASTEELRPIIAGTPAQPFLDPENARMFGSIRSVAGSAIAAFEYIQAQRAAPFSVREWVRARSLPGVLFIPYRARQIAAMRSMIATWMRLAIFEAMSQAEGHDQRLWLVIDELDALGAIDGLKDALARLRKFGCRCVLGFQSIAQVSSTYGNNEAQTIVENCGNTLILRCSGSENGGTSQFASRLIGDREILRRQVSRGSDRESALSARGARRSRNITEQHATEAAVMPSELEQLPDLCGFFKCASSPSWLKVAFGNGFGPARNAGAVPKHSLR
ncbi:MAG TPA: type IV secretion system DNA-binding domain-containing protein [Steroidobacteraceae bacterium]|jgi:type IV secretory pathway TraG/TraD family ATPase VirD4|nr:type IV secretion system DNA-binding domain-containing protein [Steroidobacteraceae bacterium]